jgi:hypothetical protein
VHAQAGSADSASLIGIWRGTSTCTDRVAAPACNDEVILYEFTAGPRPATVRWTAYKMVNGQRERMGDDLDMTFDEGEACWKVEFSSPRVKGVWRFSVKGAHLSGTAHLLPGKQKVRQVEADRE